MEIKGDRKELAVNYDTAIGAWFGRSRMISRDEMLARVFRFDELPSSDLAFIDAAIPGHTRTLLGALGRGTAEEDLKHKVEKAENYHIDFIRAAPGNGAALHSHDTEETFICLTGRWRVSWGTDGGESVELDYLDGICCPPGVMRAFENLDDRPALLLSILGGRDPGNVVWSEAIQSRIAAGQRRIAGTAAPHHNGRVNSPR
ncbi:cupin domain-containing protein [Bradyrhizobium sp. U87765 SZCCT0131]|uniref:cupin domain-containing protein n=1 Tax=unclassified Bradyrhizobium TaxID=2631580 RepID=UPI001BAD1FBF|nr:MULTISPECIES: cupin domain-containing protein [unclassified Bradyrhizobium]MBR1219272.1 cupin domain-containing protein [Bradyrhizobium sp. U87765 SZCCT0131]MBR1261923.1 cupin domain-containing protein [Bradyrhizobium sp. U87765 SZCCT0134]MBR1306224.1 cupin domain-containing protein [Bradyrhizobium sp. U87765 SZCCT0110]MBR1317705.1 cupin domain-containing protein [Bradyrhizobium sp. U87765 SZCCT0109]MBR1351407.1 cupin domain-containing protein [Bradyrhizobium sp. U87765 SZCCT0048]